MEINGVDYHYYENTRDLFRAQYDWEHLVLTAGTTVENWDLKIPISKRSAKQITEILYFIHEYIHYLQNFCTIWGVGIFSDLFLAFSKISVSGVKGASKFEPPLLGRFIGDVLFDEGVLLRYETLERLRKSDSYSSDLKNELREITGHYHGEKVILTNGICECAIGIQAIREHMANLGSFLLLGYSDEDIYRENRTFGDFIDERSRQFRKPEYWIIFDFFKSNHPNLKNLAGGLFYLFNECLTRANPDRAFYRFFEYFQSDLDRYLIGKPFIELVNQWLSASIENSSYQSSLTLTMENLNQRLEFIDRELGHDLPKAAGKIIRMMKTNIIRGDGGRNLFSNEFSFADLDSWNKMIGRFGSCLVSFNQEIRILGDDKFCKEMEEPFVLMNSATLAFKEVNENNSFFTCPFYIDIPICKAPEKREEICDRNPYEMLKIQTSDNCCNFMCGLISLGLEKRLNLRDNKKEG